MSIENHESLTCSTPLSFTLSDGSVLLAWQSSHADSEEAQMPLFANLTFGGPLPKLPIELYSLKPTGGSDRDTFYTGRHLGYTAKAGQLLEWALYVPRLKPAANVKCLGYEVLYRFNGTHPHGGMGLRITAGVPVQTAEDFDKWIRGAMAEFSDNGQAPVDVTHQRVMDLAQQTRAPTK